MQEVGGKIHASQNKSETDHSISKIANSKVMTLPIMKCSGTSLTRTSV